MICAAVAYPIIISLNFFGLSDCIHLRVRIGVWSFLSEQLYNAVLSIRLPRGKFFVAIPFEHTAVRKFF